MKKTILLISVLLMSLSLTAQKNEKSGQVYDLGNGLYILGISPNGEYVTGYEMGKAYVVSWTQAGGIQMITTANGGGTGMAISDDGVIAGQFYDSDYMYFDPSYGVELPLLNAGYYKNNQWHGLGLREEFLQNFEIEDWYGSLAEAISADGTKVGASMFSDGSILVPSIFTNDVREDLEIAMTGQGGRVLGLSADGTVACGWIAPGGSRIPAFWVNGELTVITIDGLIGYGEASDVSPNGRYIAVTIDYKAAVYDIQENELVMIGKKESAQSATAVGVSDDCIVVGYNQVGFLFDREGFIYTERAGMVNINEYLVNVAVPNAQNEHFECPMDISADGLRIVGFSPYNFDFKGFVIDLPEHMPGYYPARKLNVFENNYRQMSLTWTAAKNDPGNTLSGYNVYRDGVKVNTSLVTSTSYVDNITADGTYYYKVTAVWNQNAESDPTEQVRINSGMLAVPFLETYSASDFNANYWNIQPSAIERWVMLDYQGINAPCVSYRSADGLHSESLYSAFVDASNADELYLAFNISRPQSGSTNNSFKVEVYDGTIWNTVDVFYPSSSNSFTYQKYDITSYAANKIIRLRFTGEGNSQNQYLSWAIDNINVFGPDNVLVMEKPLRVTAHASTDGIVHVNWADPGRIATLSYLEFDEPVETLGNEGVPFILGAKFDADDLKGYYDYYLESVSAFIAEPASFRLVVFMGTQRLADQEITAFEPWAWNTFPLDEPILITKEIEKDLYFGIEVVAHEFNELPLAACDRPLLNDNPPFEYKYEGRSNLYSYDNGLTWGTLSEFDIVYSGAVKANLTGTTPIAKERLLGYKVYREGVNITGQDWSGNDILTALNNFTYIDSLAVATACYQVTAFYDTQEESEQGKFCLGDEIKGITTVNPQSEFAVYPNPSTGIINIEGKFSSINVYSLDGRLLINTKESLINLNEYPKGMYLLKINSENNSSVIQKVILQ